MPRREADRTGRRAGDERSRWRWRRRGCPARRRSCLVAAPAPDCDHHPDQHGSHGCADQRPCPSGQPARVRGRVRSSARCGRGRGGRRRPGLGFDDRVRLGLHGGGHRLRSGDRVGRDRRGGRGGGGRRRARVRRSGLRAGRADCRRPAARHQAQHQPGAARSSGPAAAPFARARQPSLKPLRSLHRGQSFQLAGERASRGADERLRCLRARAAGPELGTRS